MNKDLNASLRPRPAVFEGGLAFLRPRIFVIARISKEKGKEKERKIYSKELNISVKFVIGKEFLFCRMSSILQNVIADDIF